MCRQTVAIRQTTSQRPQMLGRAKSPLSAWPASTGRYSASRIYSASSHQTTALTFMAVCASKAKDFDPPNLRQTTSLCQVPRSSASSKRFPRFSAGHVSKRKRQPGEGIVMRTSSPHVHVRNATQAPNLLAFESFVYNIINQLRQAKLKIIASPRLSAFKGSAAPILRFPGSARPSAPDSKILGQPTPAPTSSMCQQKIVISQSSSIGNTTSKILGQ